MLQETAKKIMRTGKNVFLTGAAGTGKTRTINSIIEEFRDKGKTVAVVAPTGIAALNARGKTLNSFFGFGAISFKRGVEFAFDSWLKDNKRNRRKKLDLWGIDVLVIDEISMVSNPMLSFIDSIMKWAKNSSTSFGGVQLIVVGDFAQLPPIEKFFTKKFAWQSPSWREADFRTCYLHKIYRQSEDDFLVDILNDVRNARITNKTIELMDKLMDNPASKTAVRLYTTKMDVENENYSELAKLKGEEHVYRGKESGAEYELERFYRDSMVEKKLIIKEGALVMFTINNFQKGFVNGTMGLVTGFVGKYPVVTTSDGNKIVATPELYKKENDKKVICAVLQVPLKLAWAITSHKSQGLTLSDVEMDLTKVFEYGQAYTMLSRASSSKTLRLVNFHPNMKTTHPLTVKIEERMQEASKRAEKEAENEQ
jgi:ATP-dependent exoDNAse (exonuclease V) alpha subunit